MIWGILILRRLHWENTILPFKLSNSRKNWSSLDQKNVEGVFMLTTPRATYAILHLQSLTSTMPCVDDSHVDDRHGGSVSKILHILCASQSHGPTEHYTLPLQIGSLTEACITILLCKTANERFGFCSKCQKSNHEFFWWSILTSWDLHYPYLSAMLGSFTFPQSSKAAPASVTQMPPVGA